MKDNKIVVKVSAGTRRIAEIIKRQSPKRQGIWKQCLFVFTNKCIECDYWVVLHGESLKTVETAVCDPENIIYVSMEPTEDVGFVQRGFHRQFPTIIMTDPKIESKNIIRENLHTWWVGVEVSMGKRGHQFRSIVQDYDSFKASLNNKERVNKISVIISDKDRLDGHRTRREFVEFIKESKIGDRVEVFGGKTAPVGDKLDVISNYKYHLVIENSILNGYWSEKLADAYLGFSYPIYYGAPDVQRFFPEGAMKQIDLKNFSQSLNDIESVIKEGAFDKHRDEIMRARDLILDEYNVLNRLEGLCCRKAEIKIKCKLYPAFWFRQKAPKQYMKYGVNLFKRWCSDEFGLY